VLSHAVLCDSKQALLIIVLRHAALSCHTNLPFKLLNNNALLLDMTHVACNVRTDALNSSAANCACSSGTTADQVYSVVASKAVASIFISACNCLSRHRQGLKEDSG